MSACDPTHERGMEVRREVLGGDHVDASMERTTSFTTDFQDLLRATRGVRPGRDRVLIARPVAASP